jgi:hypothetical protein
MALYETRGKMKHQFYFLMKQTLNLFLHKNNISVSLCPRRCCTSYSPIRPYSIFPKISRNPWFLRFNAERHVITKINRMISNHTCLQTNLNRIRILDNQICECKYHTLEHLLWACSRFRAEWRQLIIELLHQGTPTNVPVRDLLGGRYWNGLRSCCSFFKRCGILI